LSLSDFTVGFAMKNVYAIVLYVKEYFYRLEQISTPLGIAQTFCDKNRSTGKGKTTEEGTIFRRVSCAGKVWGPKVSEKLVWWIVRQRAKRAGIDPNGEGVSEKWDDLFMTFGHNDG
jgi:hypothetical protein